MNKNYNTLNLPKTNFPMKGNLLYKEIKILNKWKKINIYNLIRKKNINNKIFLLHDGPPYANGDIHMGHAVNKVIKDIILKSKNFSKMNAHYIAGWDCHGLPIELKMENYCVKNNINLFRIKCKKYVLSQIENQKNDFIRLGIFSNWNSSYLTMNNNSISETIKILGKLVKLNYIYLGFKPVYWCIFCKSNLSESELIYKKIKSKSLYIKFYIKNKKNIIKNLNINNKKISFIIWTTTPWTLPDNKAISINPNLYYLFIEYNNEIIIILSNLLNDFIEKCNIKNYKILDKIVGKNISNIFCISPINNNIVPVIFDIDIELNMGTGIVHIAPGHSQLDYEIGLKYKLEIKNSLSENGYYILNTHELLNNKLFSNSTDEIINILKKNNSFFHINKYIHKYPHCNKHDFKIIFRVTNQWFINLNKNNLKDNVIKEIEKIKWIPKWGKLHMKNMIIKRPDWCISRQRYWGIPITFIINKYNNKFHPDILNIINKISNLIYKNGVESWWNLKLYNLIDDYENYIKVNDVLDVWFDSGTTFLSIIKNNDFFMNKNCIDLCIEGNDQYRGWFMSMLLITVAINNKSPLKTIISHGFVVDKYGNKMSKSLGNIIKPKKLIEKYGCDIIRLLISSYDYKKNMSISFEKIDKISEIYKKIRNTIKFLLSNLYDFNYYKDSINFENMIKLDIWILKKVYNLQKKIIYLYNSYKFHKIIKKIMYFCSIYLGSNYLEIIKDRQYTLNSNSKARKSSQTTILYILESLTIWISPILSFTSEEIWEYIPIKKKSISIFTNEWFNKLNNIDKYKTLNNKLWNLMFNIKDKINKEVEIMKNNKIINNNLELHILIYIKNNNLLKEFNKLSNEIHYFFITSKVTIKNIIYFPEETNDYIDLNEIKILIKKIDGIKCNRCWHYIENKYIKNKCNNNNFICIRCLNNIKGINEIREFI